MRQLSISKVIAIALVVFVVGFSLGSTAQVFVGPTAATLMSRLGLPVDPDLAKLLSVRQLVLARHVDKELERDVMMEGAIRGMLTRVDGGYTRYENPEEVRNRQQADTGEYAGIGVSVRMVEDQVNIESVFRGSPAQGAGLLPRDVIIGVNKDSIRGMLLNEVTDIIKGPPGTPVDLTIFRPSLNSTFEVTITRGVIIIPLVEHEIVSPGLAHVVLTQFSPNAIEQMRQAITELEARGIGHLLIDLRFNPGGYTNVVEAITDYFVGPGKVIYQVVSRDGKATDHKTKSEPIYSGTVSVLVNQASASASEIMAGALRDNLGTTILGEQSFGKGTVQTGFNLGDGSRVWITTLTYLTPAGTDINKKGIVPDVLIEQGSVDAGRDVQLEAALEYIRQNLIP